MPFKHYKRKSPSFSSLFRVLSFFKQLRSVYSFSFTSATSGHRRLQSLQMGEVVIRTQSTLGLPTHSRAQFVAKYVAV